MKKDSLIKPSVWFKIDSLNGTLALLKTDFLIWTLCLIDGNRFSQFEPDNWLTGRDSLNLRPIFDWWGKIVQIWAQGLINRERFSHFELNVWFMRRYSLSLNPMLVWRREVLQFLPNIFYWWVGEILKIEPNVWLTGRDSSNWTKCLIDRERFFNLNQMFDRQGEILQFKPNVWLTGRDSSI